MPVISPNPKFDVKSHEQLPGTGRLSFALNGGSNPDGVKDPGKIVESIVRTGTGTIRVTLNIELYELDVQVTLEDNTDSKVKAKTITEGLTAKAVFDVYVVVATALSDALDGPKVKCHLDFTPQKQAGGVMAYDDEDTDAEGYPEEMIACAEEFAEAVKAGDGKAICEKLDELNSYLEDYDEDDGDSKKAGVLGVLLGAR